jgi:predicted enzyme related to lactoylglutathione lyase
MTNRDGYPTGVPCWVDSTQPDPDAAVAFYAGLFGWECENVMPADLPMKYYLARIGGGTVGAIGSIPEGAPGQASWNTYIWADDVDALVPTVVAAGGAVLAEPFDVMEAGRMAVFADSEGAAFCVWQPGRNRGAEVVNQHGSVNFNTLSTRQIDAARDFYGAVFGWETLDLGGDGLMWTLAGYGDHLEATVNPGMREGMAQMGAPVGFEDVVAAVDPIAPDDSATHANWGVTFAVDNADETAALAAELGGTVLSPPTNLPWVRSTVIADPQGAVFTASQFVPPTD